MGTVIVPRYPLTRDPWRHISGGGLTFLTCVGRGNATALNNATEAVDVLRAVPFPVGRAGTVNLLGLDIVAAVATARARVGIYGSVSRTNLYPGALLAETGDLDAAAIAFISAAVSVRLLRDNAYWVVVQTGVAAPNIRRIPTAGQASVLGMPSPPGGTPDKTSLSLARAYGALPNPFPAGATATDATTAIPAVFAGWSA